MLRRAVGNVRRTPRCGQPSYCPALACSRRAGALFCGARVDFLARVTSRMRLRISGALVDNAVARAEFPRAGRADFLRVSNAHPPVSPPAHFCGSAPCLPVPAPVFVGALLWCARGFLERAHSIPVWRSRSYCERRRGFSGAHVGSLELAGF